MKFSLIFGSIFASFVLADTCNHDNVLRCLIGSAAVASPFCSSYLSIPVVTETISTFTPITTTTTTFSYTTTLVTSTTATSIVTSVPVAVPKREASLIAHKHNENPALTVRAVVPSPGPGCLTQVSSTSYPASRISSACSCLSVSASTTTITATAPTSTSTVLESTSTTIYSTFSTATTTVVVASTPTCTSTQYLSEKFVRYYEGSGFTENFVNSGNTPGDPPPVTISIAGALTDACAVAQTCTARAIQTPGIYLSFDLHYLTSQAGWQCTIFYNGNQNLDSSVFNVPNADVALGLGFSFPS